jgi:hypothetical protein
VGRLAEELWSWRAPVRLRAMSELERLLPRLASGQMGLLSDRQRGCLYKVVRRAHLPNYQALTVAVIRGCQNADDIMAIGFIELMLAASAWERCPRGIAKAARRCLSELRKRQNRLCLLRPAHVPCAPPQRPEFLHEGLRRKLVE